jgi:hypothetical protein
MPDGLELFRLEARIVCESYSGFVFCDGDADTAFLSGTLDLTDDNGLPVDAYKIKIYSGGRYPASFPMVFETDGRLPHNIEWHVFPDGHCCIKSIPEEMLICKQGITLISFLEQELKPYFFNQIHRELKGYYLKERAHGMAGNIAYFKETFRTEDLISIARGLQYIKTHAEPNRVSRCFCGSGEKYRRCHRDAYRKFRLFTDEQLDMYMGLLIGASKL